MKRREDRSLLARVQVIIVSLQEGLPARRVPLLEVIVDPPVASGPAGVKGRRAVVAQAPVRGHVEERVRTVGRVDVAY